MSQLRGFWAQGNYFYLDGLEIIWLLARNHAAFPGKVAAPEEGFARLYFDSLVFQPDVLRYLADKVGVERIMLGSDYPFPIGDPAPRAVIETAGFASEEVELMLSGVARKLFRL